MSCKACGKSVTERYYVIAKSELPTLEDAEHLVTPIYWCPCDQNNATHIAYPEHQIPDDCVHAHYFINGEYKCFEDGEACELAHYSDSEAEDTDGDDDEDAEMLAELEAMQLDPEKVLANADAHSELTSGEVSLFVELARESKVKLDGSDQGDDTDEDEDVESDNDTDDESGDDAETDTKADK